eukprot:TRINITY_DN21274_c0_g1_i1.p1 TRINITY_DN21274_c0_g1~~TRINITY_DN21274_c0_g1_i1.p1  ORF type:complete len:169 (+),score=41.52 TRINITY_DN21274_c0_g1_i1:60-509(+)
MCIRDRYSLDGMRKFTFMLVIIGLSEAPRAQLIIICMLSLFMFAQYLFVLPFIGVLRNAREAILEILFTLLCANLVSIDAKGMNGVDTLVYVGIGIMVFMSLFQLACLTIEAVQAILRNRASHSLLNSSEREHITRNETKNQIVQEEED